eukprot:scaffold254642_cov39-Prasinocladus_malaysianus.AAC.1
MSLVARGSANTTRHHREGCRFCHSSGGGRQLSQCRLPVDKSVVMNSSRLHFSALYEHPAAAQQLAGLTAAQVATWRSSSSIVHANGLETEDTDGLE